MMRSYMKKKEIAEVAEMSFEELVEKTIGKNKQMSKRFIKILGVIAIILPVIGVGFAYHNMNRISLGDESFVEMLSAPIAATSVKKDLLSIPSGTVKANPFLPYRNIDGADATVNDVPTFELIAPPETLNEGSEAARVMDTIVSGILYDKYSPSAILNIEGNDYLVKKGDVVNNYKIVSIAQDSVTVKLGNNTFKAGIGEILTEGEVNHNDVANLSNKFGGEKR